jgi:hypothetical protein
MPEVNPRGTFAATTNVSVDASITEIKAVLKRYGVTDIITLETAQKRGIGWNYEGKSYRLVISVESSEQRNRQKFRALLLLIKTILETAPVAGIDAAAMLLPHMVLEDGRTVAESAPQIKAIGWEQRLIGGGE